MNFKLFSILLIISVYTEAKQCNLKRHKIQHQTLEDSIRNGGGDVGTEKLKRSDVNLLIDTSFNNGSGTTHETLAIETTSSDLWVVSPNCRSAFCTGTKKQTEKGNDDDEPSTAENGLVRGYLGTQQFQIGSSYVVGLVNYTSADYVDRAVEKRMSSKASGALGLGPVNALNGSITPQNIISLSVTPSGGTLYIGETPNVPSSGMKIHIRSMSQSSWKITVGHITSSTPPFKSWCNTRCVAEIDTTFSGISGPAKDINDLNAYIGAEEDGSIDCYKIKLINHLVFHINGQRYNLEAKNFIIKEDREKDPFSNKCKSLFQVEYSNNGAWRLGLAFLQQFLTVFQYNKDSTQSYVSFIQNNRYI